MLKAPKNETIWAQILNNGQLTHVITSKATRDIYYLYKVDNDGNLIKTKCKSSDPTELEKKARSG